MTMSSLLSSSVLLLSISAVFSIPLGHASYGHAKSAADYGNGAGHHSDSFYDSAHAGHDSGAAGYYSGHKDAEHAAAAKASAGSAHESEAHGGGAGSKYNTANSDFGKGSGIKIDS